MLAGWHIEELGTFNGLAPFVAPLWETLALGVERAEFAGRALLPLNLLSLPCHRQIVMRC